MDDVADDFLYVHYIHWLNKVIFMRIETEKSWYANIWIAGDYNQAVTVCQAFCDHDPTCVTVTKTNYVYTGGSQEGVCVRMIQYPRFPTPVATLKEQAGRLAEALFIGLDQQSYSIEFPDRTVWYSAREEDN